jgi:dimethylamine/trimethylamine dehydrogenase
MLRNRFWQTSHCAGPGAERPGAQAHLRGMKAEGGWGAVFTEFCSIHPESDEYPYISARIWDQGDVRNLGYMCEVAHKYGSLAGIQLWYSGGNAPSLESREFGRAPSQWLSPIFATRSVYGCEMDELRHPHRHQHVCRGRQARRTGGLRPAGGLRRR